jgi:hypothetical protein
VVGELPDAAAVWRHAREGGGAAVAGRIGGSGRSTLGDAAEGKIQVSENTVGEPRALTVSMPRRDGTGQKDARKYAPALKNRLDLAFAKDLAPMRV